MLKYFSVKNFKQFKNVEINFSDIRDYKFSEQCIKNKLIKNAVIYGKNASGKTNFGIALMDITTHLVDREKWLPFYDCYINADNIDVPATFKYEFVFNNQAVIYEYKKKDWYKLSKEKLTINGIVVFEYDFEKQAFQKKSLENFSFENLNWEFKDKEISLLRYIANNTELETDSPIREMMFFVNKMLFFRRTGEGNNYIGFTNQGGFGGGYNHFKYIIEKNWVEGLEKFLQENGVNEKLEVKANADGSKALYFAHKQLLPISMASSGINSLILLYFWYKQFESMSLIVIDEFDAFYHYELAEKIVKLLIEKVDAQVILTSHNTNLLTNRIMRPDCYFILTKERLCSFSNATERELREGHNLEKLYVSGEFGE